MDPETEEDRDTQTIRDMKEETARARATQRARVPENQTYLLPNAHTQYGWMGTEGCMADACQGKQNQQPEPKTAGQRKGQWDQQPQASGSPAEGQDNPNSPLVLGAPAQLPFSR